jgi:DNA polymerase-3 subunit alpha
MAAVLGNSSGNIEDVSFFMEECKRMGLVVLGPDVNESLMNFSVNKQGQIRFGMSAVKGVGEAAVESIIEERNKTGPLALAGGIDCFEGVHRAQYFNIGQDGINIIEKAIRYGNSVQSNESSNLMSLFGAVSGVVIPEPPIPACEPWNLMHQLKEEKEMIGMYLSGHPLDPYKIEIDKLVTNPLKDLKELPTLKGKDIRISGIVIGAEHKVSQKTNKNYGSLTIEDFSGTYNFALFNNDYLENRKFMELGYFLFIKGRVQNRWNKEDDFEVKISSIDMLSEVREKYFNKLTMTIELERLNRDLLNYLLEIGRKNPGNCSLFLDLIDSKDAQGVKMMSTKTKVNPLNEVLDELAELGLDYKLDFKLN